MANSQAVVRNRYTVTDFRFPQEGWVPLSQILLRDDKTHRGAQIRHCRELGIALKKIPGDFLVDIADYIQKSPVSRGKND